MIPDQTPLCVLACSLWFGKEITNTWAMTLSHAAWEILIACPESQIIALETLGTDSVLSLMSVNYLCAN